MIEDKEEDVPNDIRFVFRYITYIYNTDMRKFDPIAYDFKDTYNNIHERAYGVKEDELEDLIKTYGKCTMEIVLKPWYKILVEEIINGYYIFQSFVVLIWFLNGYYRSACILCKFYIFQF